ncbi:hypothetical protein GCM10010464_17990 [Pseudonocardia yunnanensis]
MGEQGDHALVEKLPRTHLGEIGVGQWLGPVQRARRRVHHVDRRGLPWHFPLPHGTGTGAAGNEESRDQQDERPSPSATVSEWATYIAHPPAVVPHPRKPHKWILRPG